MKAGFVKNIVFPMEKHTFWGSRGPKINEKVDQNIAEILEAKSKLTAEKKETIAAKEDHVKRCRDIMIEGAAVQKKLQL